MKTNVTMVSKDRNLYGVVIKQDTKTSFMSLTDLQEAYTIKRIKEGWCDKRIEDILSNKSSAERVYYILRKQGYIQSFDNEEDAIKTGLPVFMKMIENQSLVKVMKKYGAYKTVGRGENRRTICDPYIWVLVAMELNPELYVDVVSWLTDRLILNRIEAGDRYNTLSRAISKFHNADYSKMATGLNYIVFNKHETMLRNKATQDELKELYQLQNNLSFSIKMGYIKTFDELMNVMRSLYKEKWLGK